MMEIKSNNKKINIKNITIITLLLAAMVISSNIQVFAQLHNNGHNLNTKRSLNSQSNGVDVDICGNDKEVKDNKNCISSSK